MKVSVIIPTTTGGFTYIAKLMPALAIECKKHEAEIIIVDNCSKDGTLNYLSNYDCKVIINTFNRNFSCANNQAVKIAEGEYLLLMNNDITITPGLIGEMLRTFETDNKTAIVGCCLLRENDRKVQHVGVCFTQNYIPYELGLEVPSFAPEIPRSDVRVSSVREVPAISAACMMIKKAVYEEVGGLDENYVNGWEDTDLCLKVREKGYKCWYTGRAIGYHVHHGSVSRGRFTFENQNRIRYETLWVENGRIKKVLGEFLNG